MTPVQLIRNITGISSPPDPLHASPALERLVRVHMAARQTSRPVTRTD